MDLNLIRKLREVPNDLLEFIIRQEWAKVWVWGVSSSDPNDDRCVASDLAEADVFSSKVSFIDGYTHRPVLDIDIPAILVPSSTPGHSHLLIDKRLTWPQYEKLLLALADAGIIERGFCDLGIKRKATMVRLPWIKK